MPESDVQVKVFRDLDTLSQGAADALTEVVEAALSARGRVAIALAGGSTPRRLYELLAGPYRALLPWNHLYLFWGDERFVPAKDPASNYGAARDALLRHVPLPPDHVFPIPTDLDTPAQAVDAYAATLRRFFGYEEPAFDLTLLGLGADGHIASLFPENAPEQALWLGDAPWVEAVEAPPRYAPRTRITLTLPLLNQSRQVFFLVAGADKEAPLFAILEDPSCILPGVHVQAQEQVTWFVDVAAYGPR